MLPSKLHFKLGPIRCPYMAVWFESVLIHWVYPICLMYDVIGGIVYLMRQVLKVKKSTINVLNLVCKIHIQQAGGNDFDFTYQFGRWNRFSPTKLKFSPTKFFLALQQEYLYFCKSFLISAFTFFKTSTVTVKKSW